MRARARLIVINATFRMAPWADVLYASDARFYEQYIGEIRTRFKGELWTVAEEARERFGAYWIRHNQGNGYCKEPDTINGGGNSGYAGIHLAATFGAKRILLLGFDMQRTGGKEHWHGKHEGGLPNGNGFPRWMQALDTLYADLTKMGVELINCTRETAWQTAPRMPIEAAFAE